MAESWWDIRVCDDMSSNALYGGLIGLHRGDQNVVTWAPMVSVVGWKQFLIACKHGNNTEVAAAGLALWGGWWSNEIAARGLVDAVRSNVKAWLLADKL